MSSKRKSQITTTNTNGNSSDSKKKIETEYITRNKRINDTYKSTIFVFSLFFISSILSAIYNRIVDCDEYMNYWEPTHYLLYNKGLQTWEYSPTYSLRSYAYLLLHAFMGRLLNPFSNGNKIILFYLIKIGIGFFTSIAQTIFYRGVKNMFGREISRYTLIFMLFSPAFFLSGSNFLPTSFSMTTFMAAYGFWMLYQSSSTPLSALSPNESSNEAIYSVFLSATSVFMGWPFVIVLVIPIALNLMIRNGFLKVFMWALLPVIAVFIPMILIDYQYYGKWVIAIYNIIAYNFTSNHSGGSQLYGIEDWPFYFINSFVNYNIVFLFSLLTIPLLIIFRKWSGSLKNLTMVSIIYTLCPYYIWFGFMTYLPHKEERFLFVIYPFIALAGSISFYIGLNILNAIILKISGGSGGDIKNKKKNDDFKLKSKQQQHYNVNIYHGFVNFIKYLIIICFILLSVSRIYSTYVNYTAPFNTLTHLNNNVLLNGNISISNFSKNNNILKSNNNNNKKSVNICIGKEWHRYPSNFFLPNDNNEIEFNLKFIESDFKGHLPKPFSTLPNGTAIIPTNMNDQNKQEFDRYIKPNECSYIIDFDSPTQNEEHYVNDTSNWKVIYSTKFLDAAASTSSLYRAFWIPKLSNQKNVYNNYYILEKI
ncbi:hypothetical protein ACTFIR_008278 [Dictyostelium discoideum]